MDAMDATAITEMPEDDTDTLDATRRKNKEVGGEAVVVRERSW